MNVALYDAKKRLSARIDRVEKCEETTVARHGKPLAKLVPAKPKFDPEKVRAVAEGLIRASKGLTLGGLAMKGLIEEGRELVPAPRRSMDDDR